MMILFFFFKQKTAYEMRISDWSSDVCSSDLKTVSNTYDVQGEWTKDRLDVHFAVGKTQSKGGPAFQFFAQAKPRNGTDNGNHQIGRASCRERVCPYV